MASSTTSIRLPDDLKALLASTSRQMKKPKGTLITQALREYLLRHNRELFLAEARRQSILASKKKWKDAELWEEAIAEVWDAK
jgi:predicted transcriptional regulator